MKAIQICNANPTSGESPSATIMNEMRILELPSEFLEWQSQYRMKLFEEIEMKGPGEIKVQPSHLAVMATVGRGPFPINLVTKGLGLVPKKSSLQRFTELFQEALAREHEKDSLGARLSAARAFYCDPQNFDPSILGGLEIFEGRTAQNLEADSRVSLLYTGEAPHFKSFQINGILTKVHSNDPYYHFLLSARLLFAREPFHIFQARYPYAFLFHPVQFLDKTPFSRR